MQQLELVQIGILYLCLKSGGHFPKNGFIYFIESPLKIMKNACYFMLKAFFVLEVFQFLSIFCEHVGKQLDKKAKVNFKHLQLQLQYTYCPIS